MFSRYTARHPGSGVVGVLFFDLCCLALRAIFWLVYRARVEGLEHIPPSGPVLLISNHESFYDPPLIGCWLKVRQLDFLARGGLFKFKPFGWLIQTLHAMPIKQGSGDTGAMKEAIRRLGEGRAMLIFPEGSRTSDGTIQPFQRGTAVLLKRADCAIVPVAVRGVYEAWPRDRKLPRLFARPLAVVYGEPIQSKELMEQGGADGAMAELAQRVERLAARADELRG